MRDELKSLQKDFPFLTIVRGKGLLNAIVIETKDLQISSHQYSILANFNFDEYRKYSERSLIQIEKGPLVSLFSFQEMEQNGIAYSKTEAERKKSAEPVQRPKHDIITLVNLGWNYLPPVNSETGH